MAELAHPHDRFLKELLSRPAAVRALFRERLPRELAARLSDELPRKVDCSFIAPGLRERTADRLFELRLKKGGSVLVYVLVEHKSAVDPRVALQLLVYLSGIWEQLAQARGGKLPQIIPMVVYHGEAPWTVAPTFSAVLQPAAPLGVKALDFELVVVDVGAIDDDRLSADPTLRAGLLALKYATREALQRLRLGVVLEALRVAHWLLEPVMVYMLRTYRQIDREVLISEVKQVMPDYDEAAISIAAREWLEDGRAEGRAEGRSEGRAEALLEALAVRFGPVSDATRDRVASGSPSDREAWFRRALTVASLDEVFGLPH